jgi:hypothetical protein
LSDTVRCPQCGLEAAEGVLVRGLCPNCLLGLGLDPSEDGAGSGLKRGSRIGRYEILDRLGSGGMGEVYRARDIELGRDVAIKVLPDAVADDPERVARFRREARLLASINHPHIAAIYGIEQVDGLRCLVLELVEGQTLDDRVAAGTVSVEEALDAAVQIADALEAAHEKGIVHRDLKPSNVMVTPKGRVKVLDFGIAKVSGGRPSADSTALTVTGTLVGTTPYMSPEQIRGGPVDARSDLWSFGCVLFELLTGRRAFDLDTTVETLSAILEREPDLEALPPETPRDVRELLAAAFRKNPDQRLSDIAESRLVLERALASVRSGRRPGAMVAGRVGFSLALVPVVLAASALLVVATGGLPDGIVEAVAERIRPLLTDGGAIAALLLLAAAAATFFWKFLEAARVRLRGAGAARGFAVAALVAYVPVIPAVLVAGRSWAALTLVVGGAIVWVARGWLGSSSARRWSVVAAQVVVVAAAWQAQGWWTGREDRMRDEIVDVYVVLPFEKLNDEQEEELLDVSEHYRSTLASIFSDLDSVHVMPTVFDPEVMRSYPPECSYRRVLSWLGESELSADVVLCSTVDLFDDDEAHSGVVLVSRVKRVRDETLVPVSNMIRQTGTYSDITWLALKTGFRIVRLLKDDPGVGLSREDEAKVKGRILEAYGVFLSFKDPAGEAASRVERALGLDAVPDAEILAALDAYDSPVDLGRYASRSEAARSAFTTRVIGD